MTRPGETAVVWDDALCAYDFGPAHPMDPVRLELTAELARSFGLFDLPRVRLISAPVADGSVLETIHDPVFVQAVRDASAAGLNPSAEERTHLNRWGLATPEVPIFPGMDEASARLVGGSIAAVTEILEGRCERAVSFSGGMHHAKSGFAGGFCVFNDAAAAIAAALAAGEERIVYLDLDVHHGDGVEQIFWNDPLVTTISIHQSGDTLYPGTGFIQDSGGPAAPGTAINIPMPAGTRPEDWLRAIDGAIDPLIRAIRPTLLVTQHGADSHSIDPLADMDLTIEAQRAAMLMCRDLATTAAGGRWLALGGGGYSVADVVPRSWTHLVAVVLDADIDADAPIPEEELQRMRDGAHRTGAVPPRAFTTMGDGSEPVFRPWSAGFNPEHPVDRLVQSARRAHFPEWGLDPLYD